MAPYEFLEHCADTGLRVRVSTKEALFEDAALGMFAIISDESPGGWAETRKLYLGAQDEIALLADWLCELMYLFEVKSFWPVKVSVELEDECSLRAEIEGLKYKGVITGAEIKAVAYHLLEINHGAGGGFETDIYFDM